MNHLPHLIQDLGLILIVAGITTLLFKWLKQPVVLGYILAGLLVSPHVPFIPTISDIGSIQLWAEIGVIILLFSLGLEFSFKKLVN
jgi:CPA2 family monovalent cation:H+ antiporter-2